MGHYVYRYIHPLHPWLYVGKCNSNLRDRINKHESDPSDNISREHLKELKESTIYFVELDSEAESALVERYLINEHSPMLNVRYEGLTVLQRYQAKELIKRHNQYHPGWTKFDRAKIYEKRITLSKQFIKKSRYSFSTVEQRAFMYILMRANEFRYNGDAGMLTVHFSLDDYFAHVITSRGGQSSRSATNALLELACKRIPIMTSVGKEYELRGIIGKPVIGADRIVGVQLNPLFASYCNMTSQIDYNANTVMHFTHKYSARLYEIMLAYKPEGEQKWTYTAYDGNELAKMMATTNRNSNKSINDAIEEINNISDISIELQQNIIPATFVCTMKNRFVLDNPEVK